MLFYRFSALALMLLLGRILHAQQPTIPDPPNVVPMSSSSSLSALPDAPSERRALPRPADLKKAPPSPVGAMSSPLRGNVSCGSGSVVQAAVPNGGNAMCGFGFTFVPFVQVEFGGIGPQGGWPRFYISTDGYVPLAPVASRLAGRLHGEPVALFGYTKMFYNSNDLDFGVGWDHHLNEYGSLIYEVRDYVQFSSPAQHTVMFRMNLVGGGVD